MRSPLGHKKRGAGVGCMVQEPVQATQMAMKSKQFRKLYEQGLVAGYEIHVAEKVVRMQKDLKLMMV